MKFTFKIKYNSYLVIGLIAICLVLINLIAIKHFYRWDLTEDKQYVISDVSKNTVGELDDLLTVKVYFSKKLPPNLSPLSVYVKDILSEYQAFSKGNMIVEYIDPADNEKLKQEVTSLGIPEVQMNILEKDKWQVQKGFLGIALSYAANQEVIPVVKEIRNFEYDFTSALKRVTSNEIKTVGFLTGHKEHLVRGFVQPEEEYLKDYNVLYQSLLKNYEVKDVNLENGLPITGVDTLIVAGPKDRLTDRDLYEIDQFVMNGGNAMFLVDGVQLTQGLQASPVSTGLEELVGFYGVKVNNDFVLDVLNETVPFSSGIVQFLVPYPFWPKFVLSNFLKENPIVSKLESISMAWISSVEESFANSDVRIDLLVKTSPKGWLQTGDFTIDPNKEFNLTDDQRKEIGVIALAEGKFKSYFEGKDIPKLERKNESGELEIVEDDDVSNKTTKVSVEEDGQIIVVGDSDFVSDGMIQRFPQNLLLFLNSVDYLTLDSDLIYIRSKIITERPLQELSESKKRAIKAFGVLTVPGIFIIYGVYRNIRRRKIKKQISII